MSEPRTSSKRKDPGSYQLLPSAENSSAELSVEVPGIEPGSSSTDTELLRA